MNKVGIIGSGTMGIGIAQVAAMNQCEVFLYDQNAEQTEKKGRKTDRQQELPGRNAGGPRHHQLVFPIERG